MWGKYFIVILMVIFLVGCKSQITAESVEVEEQSEPKVQQQLEPEVQKTPEPKKESEKEPEKEPEKAQETKVSEPQKGESETQQSVVPTFCKPGEELTGVECTCQEGYRLCAEQKRCIKENSCCGRDNCGSFEYCVPTKYRTTFCIQTETQKMCKSVTEQDREEVFDDINGIRINVTNFFNEKTVFDIDGETIELMPETKQEYDGMQIWSEETQLLGGSCREDIID